MGYPLPTVCAAQTDMYTCPCSCARQFTRDALTEHLIGTYGLAAASVTRWAARYRQAGQEMPSNAVREVWDTYGDMLQEALSGQTPDWRNSDGLAGYAASVVRYASEETT